MFSIAYFASSDFVLPILNNIYDNEGQTLLSVFVKQQSWLIDNQAQFSSIIPSFWLQETHFSEQIKTILDAKINLKLVVTQPDRQNRGKIFSNPVTIWARNKNLPVFTPEKINSEFEKFQSLASPLDISIVSSFGQILSQKVLDSSKFGFINWHPSKLPQYRGATPMQSALKNGEKHTALSWIEMNKAMDAGDIRLQIETEILLNENFTVLSERMGILGANTWAIAVVSQIMNRLEAKAEILCKQDESAATFCQVLDKSQATVDIQTQSAIEIYNQWRGYEKFPGTSFLDDYFAQEVKIVECQLEQNPEIEAEIEDSASVFKNWRVIKSHNQQKVFLNCANSTWLEIKKICLANGKNIDFRGFQFK